MRRRTLRWLFTGLVLIGIGWVQGLASYRLHVLGQRHHEGALLRIGGGNPQGQAVAQGIHRQWKLEGTQITVSLV